jgi:hypothetical protein
LDNIKETHKNLHLIGAKVFETIEKDGVTKENSQWYFEQLLKINQKII